MSDTKTKGKAIPNAEVQSLAVQAVRAWETQAMETATDSTEAWWLFQPITGERSGLRIVRSVRGPPPARDKAGRLPEDPPVPTQAGRPEIFDEDGGVVWRSAEATMGGQALGATATSLTELASMILALAAPP